MPQEESFTTPGSSQYKILGGDVGEVVDILDQGPLTQPMFIIRWDKFPGKSNRWGCDTSTPERTTETCWTPAPVFNIQPHQVMAIQRRIIFKAAAAPPAPPPVQEPTPTRDP